MRESRDKRPMFGSGHHFSPEAQAVIAHVDRVFRQMLNEDAILAKGDCWSDLASWETDKQGNREDHCVARLCGVSAKTVRQCRQRSHFSEPSKRGRRPSALPLQGGAGEGGLRDVTEDTDDEGLELYPANNIGPVYGTFVKIAEQKPAEFAIGLTLGRAMALCISQGLPASLLPSLLSLLRLSGADIGHHYHHRHFLSTFTALADRIRSRQVRASFLKPPAPCQQ